MDHHLGQEDQGANSRNGYGRKTVTTDGGRIEIEVPRDRAGSFDPQLIAKYQRRFPGFDDKIISMYARGMSTQEITGHLRRSEEQTSELQSLMRISYAVFCLKKKTKTKLN